MKTLFLSFLVFIMIFAVFGAKLKYIAGDAITDILNLKKDIASVNVSPDIKDIDVEKLQQRLQNQYLAKNRPEDADREIEDMLKEIRKEQIMVVNPVMEKFKNIGKSEQEQKILSNPRKYFINIIQNIEKSNYSAGITFFIIAGIVFLSVFITSGGEASGFGVLLAKFGFTISRLLIFLGAITALFIWIAVKYNIFINMAGIILWGPFTLMIFSAISLKVYDFNSPIWNRMFLSTVWPIVSGLIINTL